MSRYSWRRKLPSVSIFPQASSGAEKAVLRGRSSWRHSNSLQLTSAIITGPSGSATSTARFQRAMDALLAGTPSRAPRKQLAELEAERDEIEAAIAEVA